MIESYSDVAVIRHPVVGSAAELASGSAAPVINGGDGAGQHPTQALLDLYTILKEKGKVKGLTVALAGDLKNGRTVHSLSALLSRFGVRFYFVAPDALKMPVEISENLKKQNVEIIETTDLAKALTDSDVVYMTRIQKERFEDPAEYERLKGSFELDLKMVNNSKKGLTIMHPLPRVNEIATDVDGYEGAAYFRQPRVTRHQGSHMGQHGMPGNAGGTQLQQDFLAGLYGNLPGIGQLHLLFLFCQGIVFGAGLHQLLLQIPGPVLTGTEKSRNNKNCDNNRQH